MRRAPRDLSDTIQWFPRRRCFRFKYRDPSDGRGCYLYGLPSKFQDAGIDLPRPEMVRKDTIQGKALVKKLRSVFLASLGAVRLHHGAYRAPLLSEAVKFFFELYEKKAEYGDTLRRIYDEFIEATGDKPFDEVIDLDLKNYETILSKRVGPVTVRSYMRQLGMLINFGVKKGWCSQDPRLTYKLPKDPLREPDPFSMDELKKFFALKTIKVHCHPGIWEPIEWAGVGMLCLGLRPIELEHARWENLNPKERFLYIAQSHPAKMPQACQNQPIPNLAWPFFEARRQESGPIWLSSLGGPYSEDAQARARRTVQAHFPDFQWKRFRKTYATILEQAGNDVVMISRLLRQSAGGKNVTVAQRHYIGRSHQFLRQTVDDAFEILRGTGPFPSA